MIHRQAGELVRLLCSHLVNMFSFIPLGDRDQPHTHLGPILRFTSLLNFLFADPECLRAKFS